MPAPKPHHVELLRAIDAEPELRTIVRRIAELSHAERLDAFCELVRDDAEMNTDTRRFILRIARNEPFLRDADEHLGPAGPSVQSPLAGAISSVG